MKRYLITSIILSIFFQICSSQDKIDILFIGNSLTGNNGLPGLFKNISEESNKNVQVESCLNYGQSLRQYVNNSSVINKINEKDWDYVIIQSDDITAFDDMYDIEINALTKLKTYIHNNYINTTIIYEMIWGLRDGVYIQGEGYYSYEDYINKIYNGTLYIADELNLDVAPVGWAWKQCRQTRPDIELFSSDKAHPAYPGSFLGACVFFNIIFKERIENNNYFGNLSEDDAVFLQSIANEVVINDLQLWTQSPLLSLSDLQVDGVTVPGFHPNIYNYNIELAEGTTTVPIVTAKSTNNNININIINSSTLPGITTITLSTEDGSMQSTYTINFNFTTSIKNMELEKDINIYPNPTHENLYISIDKILYDIIQVKIYNSTGNLVKTKKEINETSIHNINLNNLPNGMYLIEISLDKNTFLKKIIIR